MIAFLIWFYLFVYLPLQDEKMRRKIFDERD